MTTYSLRHWSVLTLLSCLGVCLPAQDEVSWRGELRAIDALDGAPAAVVDTLKAWSPYARERGGRLVLSDDRRILLVVGDNHARKGKKEPKSIEKMLSKGAETLAATDRFLPPASDRPLVVVCARTVDYPRLLGHVAVLEPRLVDWASTMANRVTGFALAEPLCAAWIEDPRDVEEWRPENELVHRLAQLTLRSRAKALPDWLLVGMAWHVEDAVCGGIYCFPNRSSFVSVNEHTGWGQQIANQFKAATRKKAGRAPTLQIEEFASWRPGASGTEYTDGTVCTVFGIARYLATQHPQAVPALVAAMAKAHEDGSRVWVSEFEWRTDPDYRVPADAQQRMLEAIDPRLMEAASAWFAAKKAADRRSLGGRS